jgi:hypothetical protein
MNEINHIQNLLNGNEIILKIPFNQNIDIIQTIEELLQQFNQDICVLHNCECVNNCHLDIDFDLIDENHNSLINVHNNYPQIYNFHNHNNYNNYNTMDIDNEDNKIDHFNYCYEIDETVSKSEKIKKDDSVLTEQCFICMDEYKVNQFKRNLPNCNHCFHKKCIDKWLKKKASCPICRDNLLK